MNGDRSRPSAGSGSTRRSIRTRACCCTCSPTASGASTSSSAGTPTRSARRSPRTSCRASGRCSRSREGRRVRARMGQRLHLRLPAHGRVSATAACCSPATRRTACRRSARAAPTRACRTPTTWRWKLAARACRAGRPMRCSTAMPASAKPRPTRTSCNSTRATDFITPKSEISRLFRDAVLELAEDACLRAQRWSTAAGCRCRRRCTTRR